MKCDKPCKDFIWGGCELDICTSACHQLQEGQSLEEERFKKKSLCNPLENYDPDCNCACHHK